MAMRRRKKKKNREDVVNFISPIITKFPFTRSKYCNDHQAEPFLHFSEETFCCCHSFKDISFINSQMVKTCLARFSKSKVQQLNQWIFKRFCDACLVPVSKSTAQQQHQYKYEYSKDFVMLLFGSCVKSMTDNQDGDRRSSVEHTTQYILLRSW